MSFETGGELPFGQASDPPPTTCPPCDPPTSFPCLPCCLPGRRFAAADTTGQEEFFETKIRPVLVAKCYECHSSSSKEAKGGLLLDTREGIRRGGDSGHAVVPGELEESMILAAMRHESFEMPPDEKLPDTVIADFVRWIRMGAHDPREGKSALIRREIDFERAREFWAFQPITEPDVPAVKNGQWPKQDVDAFILARLEAERIRACARRRRPDIGAATPF